MKGSFVAIAFLLGISGCVGSVNQRIATANKESGEIYVACQKDAHARGIDPLYAKTNFFASQWMELWMLDLKDVATDEEKVAIKRLMDSFRECGAKQVASDRKNHGETVAQIRTIDINRQLSQLADLYNGKVSWGSFNSDLQMFDQVFSRAYKEAAQQYWQTQYADEENRRQAMQAVGRALQAYSEGLKTYSRASVPPTHLSTAPIYDPVTTSCSTNGNLVTCTQQSLMMTSQKIISCHVNGTLMTCREQ